MLISVEEGRTSRKTEEVEFLARSEQRINIRYIYFFVNVILYFIYIFLIQGASSEVIGAWSFFQYTAGQYSLVTSLSPDSEL